MLKSSSKHQSINYFMLLVSLVIIHFNGTYGVLYNYLGCFRDDFDRALPNHIQGYFDTANDCNIACYYAGFKYSGRQYVGECWCGNSGYDKHGSSDMCNDCDSANVGGFVNCVYEAVAESSVPTPVPTSLPTSSPTSSPTSLPTSHPTSSPTLAPTDVSTEMPSSSPVSYPVSEIFYFSLN